MRGGNLYYEAEGKFISGLSPHARGKPQPVLVIQMVSGSIPACAGETIISSGMPSLRRVYPRMRGGNRT